MGRRLLALGLAVALQAGAVTSPLVHAHLDDHHHGHHDAGRVHAHVDGHAIEHHADPHTSAIHGEESPWSVVHVPFFVAAHADVSLEPALPHAPFIFADAGESLMRQPPDVVRSHGPPAARPSAPRAPPRSSVLI